jgi:hypothetical protein
MVFTDYFPWFSFFAQWFSLIFTCSVSSWDIIRPMTRLRAWQSNRYL